MAILRHIICGMGSLFDPTPLPQPPIPRWATLNVRSGYRQDALNISGDFKAAMDRVTRGMTDEQRESVNSAADTP